MADQSASKGPEAISWSTTEPFDSPSRNTESPAESNAGLRDIAEHEASHESGPSNESKTAEYTDGVSSRSEKGESDHISGAKLSTESERHEDVVGTDWARQPDSESDAQHATMLDKVMTKADEEATNLATKVKTVANKFHVHSVKSAGPSKLFNPTNVRMHVRFKGEEDSNDNGVQRPDREMALVWRSRDNRKGRNSVAVPLLSHVSGTKSHTTSVYKPRLASTLREVGQNLKRMFTTFPYWDMAFWSGWSYTVGSALFVMCGAFSWGPLAFPGGEFPGEDTYGSCFTFFFGALFYQVGAVLAYLEAVNDGSFHGSAMRRFLEGHDHETKELLDEKLHHFFGHFIPHKHRHNDHDPENLEKGVDPEAGWRTKDDPRRHPRSPLPGEKKPAPRRGGVDFGETEEGQSSTYVRWRWYPSWHALRTHHVYEIGWIACTVQLFGVTLYGVTAVVIWPLTFTDMKDWQELGAYWVPQMVAAACFLIASIMFTLETQEKWWKPEPMVLGWWLGVWATIGSIGFEAIAAFGPTSMTKHGHWAEYQSDLATIWGSGAYLVSSFLQWYEAVNKRPVDELFSEPGEMKSWQIHPI